MDRTPTNESAPAPLTATILCARCGASPRLPSLRERQLQPDVAARMLAYRQQWLAQHEEHTVPTVTLPAAVVQTGETVDAWFARYFEWKRKLPGKNGSIRQDESKYRAWISPRVGTMCIAAPRAQLAEAIEELRDDLDDAVRAYVKNGKGRAKDKSRTSGKNAQSIWGVLVTGMNYASTAPKRSGLRVREDNPCDKIRAPEKSPDKTKTVLRPVEFIALLVCDAVPVEWRETYAVALYTYARPGELRVLTWDDVDFTTNKIKIRRAWDYDAQEEKPTKTWESREVPIEPTLRPLLVAMHERCGGKGLVLPMLSSLADETAISKVFRRHLDAAGVDRADLFTVSTTQIGIRFRSLRDTGITWRLWRGDNHFVVQRNAGHKRFSTTEKYIGDVETLTDDCGEPFPPIPGALVDASRGPGEGTPGGSRPALGGGKGGPPRGETAVRVRTEGVEPSRELPR